MLSDAGEQAIHLSGGGQAKAAPIMAEEKQQVRLLHPPIKNTKERLKRS